MRAATAAALSALVLVAAVLPAAEALTCTGGRVECFGACSLLATDVSAGATFASRR